MIKSTTYPFNNHQYWLKHSLLSYKFFDIETDLTKQSAYKTTQYLRMVVIRELGQFPCNPRKITDIRKKAHIKKMQKSA